MTNMTLGSLFDGIGGFPLAGYWLGMRPVWASEIEAAPISITKRHFPDMAHLGDILQINGGEIEPVDVITFGSPCQDLSVAGKRAGLEGERSGLFTEAVRIIREMREATNGKYPSYAVWENVPGALSSNKGEDFRAVLEGIASITEPSVTIPRSAPRKWKSAGSILGDGWSLAWRIMDAQYWGVPQRRRRIYLVADLGGVCAAEILFKRQDLHWHPAQSGAEREGAPQGIGGGAACAIPIHDKATRYRGGGAGRWDDGASNGLLIGQPGEPSPTLDTAGRHAVAVLPDTVGTLRANGVGIRYAPKRDCDLDFCIIDDGENRGPNMIVALPFDTTQITSPQNGSKPKAGDPCYTLSAGMHPPSVVAAFCGGASITAGSIDYQEECSPTLKAAESGTAQIPCVYAMQGYGDYAESQCANTQRTAHDVNTSTLVAGLDCRNATENGDLCGTLQAHGKGGYSHNTTHPVRVGRSVRRLTPVECERLQGYPDGWTELGIADMPISPKKLERDIAKGVLRTGSSKDELLQTISDSARYAAIGNSVALPCVLYVLEGIQINHKRRKRK